MQNVDPAPIGNTEYEDIGPICDKKVPVKLKHKIYKIVTKLAGQRKTI